jgi:Trp operon repressor
VNLYDKFKKLSSKYSTSKKNRAYLLVEKKTLEKKVCIVIDNSNEINKLENENKSLREKINKLNKTLAKFTQGSKIIETMLFKPNMCF